MNAQQLLRIVVICSLLYGAGCCADADIPPVQEEDHSPTVNNPDKFTLISNGVGRASSLTLYEGLPHQVWEGDQLKKELATKKTVLHHNYPFYERPLPVSATDVETLRRLSAATDSFAPFGGFKTCGGYHPDYCLVWMDGATSYELLICFGCHEMKLYGPEQELLLDIRRDAFKEFKAILTKYQDQRPAQSLTDPLRASG